MKYVPSVTTAEPSFRLSVIDAATDNISDIIASQFCLYAGLSP
jgi:hypothetical protein